MRGQYSSAMEHAVPEQFWVDKSQCRYTDETGTIKNPTQADCAQGVSAVKAIAIAQAEGQRIYTINQSNAATALPKLPVCVFRTNVTGDFGIVTEDSGPS